MHEEYLNAINENVERVYAAMKERVTDKEMQRIREAFELAREAHSQQTRKSGEPYIMHPIAVARIVAEELMLGANPVIAAFLHDVVEDTPYTIDDIEKRFGGDVAFLVRAVTKEKKDKYVMSKQLDNFKQMLDTVHYDIRVLLIKLADRLHNMRTLNSMRPDKQMKIAGETDYFYAPLANRLGLYNIKIELENLSLRYRCPHEYKQLVDLISRDEESSRAKLEIFKQAIIKTLSERDIHVEVEVCYRQPYSLWRKMRKFGDDYSHLKYRRFINVIFADQQPLSEKNTALSIYSVLTDTFKEKPGGISNYIDSPKENGYQSFHVKLLSPYGKWEEVHICSERMVRDSQLGCVAERTEQNIQRWIDKFRDILRDISYHAGEGNFIESVVTSFYNDDIMCFTPKGKPMVLPQRATALDFAFEIHSNVGRHAHYARINGQLATVKTELHRGDVVEIFTNPEVEPKADWIDSVITYKAKRFMRSYNAKRPKPKYKRCTCCKPIPGEEVVGFVESNGSITVHKRDCEVAIRLASQQGDSIVSVDYQEDNHTLYPVTINVRAVDRYHLFIDLADCITNKLKLTMNRFSTSTNDAIVNCEIDFAVHSFAELQSIISNISVIQGVDEVKEKL
jgi:GTP pyrophosphokinase